MANRQEDTMKKKVKRVVVSVSFPADLLKEIITQAKYRRLTRSAMIATLVSAALRRKL